jgi:uncharacterized repeat protein (TIGR03803 family)
MKSSTKYGVTSTAYVARGRMLPARVVLALASIVWPAVVSAVSAQAQTSEYRVLYSFTGADGGYPYAGLILDAAGNLYGTTVGGGAYALGTVFVVNRSGQEKVLHSFGAEGDGTSPEPGLVQDAAGNLYGTTEGGGAYALGTVFVVNRSGQEKILHSFGAEGDGVSPYAGLVQDAAGNFYGTTNNGGAYGAGTVFVVNRDGQEKVLHSFGAYYGDGSIPFAGLVQDAAGNFYGTTPFGGAYGGGTVFVLNRNGHERVLHSFGADGDGAFPYAGLVQDAAGNFYGTTNGGGAYGYYGTVFVVSPTGQEKVLHSFGAEGDGAYNNAGLVQDAAGNLYGTTSNGGAYGYGTVFELTP